MTFGSNRIFSPREPPEYSELKRQLLDAKYQLDNVGIDEYLSKYIQELLSYAYGFGSKIFAENKLHNGLNLDDTQNSENCWEQMILNGISNE